MFAIYIQNFSVPTLENFYIFNNNMQVLYIRNMK